MTKWFSIFCIACISSACAPSIRQSLWQNQKVTPDGQTNEWQLPLTFYDKKSTLQYTISNDSNNMYICFRAIDRTLQMKIEHAGMQIWFDTTGKYERLAGLEYPLVSGANIPFSDANQVKNGFRNLAKKEMNTYNLQNISPAKFIPTDNAPIKASMNIDEFGILVMEFAIPLNIIFGNNIHYYFEHQTGITIVVNGFAPPQDNEGFQNERFNNDGPEFTMNMQPGGMPGGQMPGGMPPGPIRAHNEDRPSPDGSVSLNKPNTIEFAIKLAKE